MKVHFLILTLIMRFLFMLNLSRGDVSDPEVSCGFMESCILPCSFKKSDDVIIHWFHTTEDIRVHSYYNKLDELGHQDQRFRGRTSLFKDQISAGNASLLLTRVKVQDEGRYKCYISTFSGNQNSLIHLNVEAPVHKVDIQQEGNRISCSSERIYPEPELTWTTSPPSNMNLWNTTRVQQTEQQLYNISSSLVLSDNVADLDFICTVKTPGNSRRATLLKPASITGLLTTETTISCSASNPSLSSCSLVWKFNHHQTILNKSSSNVDYTVSEEWRQHVKSVSDSGSLTLQKLSSGQEGKYTCELSDAEETLTKNTDLRISADHPNSDGGIIGGVIGIIVGLLAAAVSLLLYVKDHPNSDGGIIGGVIGIIVGLLAVAVFLLLYFKGQRSSRDENTPNPEVNPLQPPLLTEPLPLLTEPLPLQTESLPLLTEPLPRC